MANMLVDHNWGIFFGMQKVCHIFFGGIANFDKVKNSSAVYLYWFIDTIDYIIALVIAIMNISLLTERHDLLSLQKAIGDEHLFKFFIKQC